MNWLQLLNANRFGDAQEETIDFTRSDFQRDYDRLIFSASFRRLQDKTQVFPLPGSIFVHNRLTHSLEVSSVGRSLGNSVIRKIANKLDADEQTVFKHIPTVVSAACLAHDMGNPPFGHSGEEAIRQFFKDHQPEFCSILDEWEWCDLIRYEGNANAIRLLTQQLNGRRIGGYRLSYAVLASIAKYPYPSILNAKKYGFFKSDAKSFASIAKNVGLIEKSNQEYCRHPLAYLVEAADDICYQIMDIEDAHKLGILSTTETINLYREFFADDAAYLSKIDKTLTEVIDINEQVAYLRAIVIGLLVEKCADVFVQNYSALMNGEKVGALVDGLQGAAKNAIKTIEQVAITKVYNYSKVVEIEIAGYRIIGSLLEAFSGAVLNPSTKFDKKIVSLLPAQFHCTNGPNYDKLMSVLDFVSGMTDDYALKTYRLFQGINLPSL